MNKFLILKSIHRVKIIKQIKINNKLINQKMNKKIIIRIRNKMFKILLQIKLNKVYRPPLGKFIKIIYKLIKRLLLKVKFTLKYKHLLNLNKIYKLLILTIKLVLIIQTILS